MVMPIAANPQIAACEPSDIRLEMVKNTGILISTNTANSAIRIGVAFLNTRLFTRLIPLIPFSLPYIVRRVFPVWRPRG